MTAEKPEIDFPEGPPPEDLEITDVTVGSGAEAKPGQQVRVHYDGVAHEFFGLGQVVRGAYDAEGYAVASMQAALGK